MVIEIPSIAVSTYDMQSIYNAIDSLMTGQASSGKLNYYGWTYGGKTHSYTSFTYHLFTLVDLLYYALHSGNQDYLEANWDRLTRALSWSLSFVDGTGLMDVTTSTDWGRKGQGGHVRSAALSILHTTILIRHRT